MKQNHTLYEILRTDSDGYLLHLLANHPVYQGHFPDNPITPGVLTLQMVRECLSLAFGHDLHYFVIKNCRFMAMIRPGNTLRLSFVTETDGETVKVKANLVGVENNEDLRLSLDAELR